MRRRHVPGEPEPPTKGELKRQAQSVQELAEQLIGAPESLLAGLDLPENVGDAVMLARKITSHAALVRQKQYVGKLMRKIDVEPIRAALESRNEARRLQALRFHRVERWRDRILEEGEPALEELFGECAALDTLDFRRLAAEARRDHGAGGSPRASRELFRALAAALAPA
jgi:ribosome-associated protein